MTYIAFLAVFLVLPLCAVSLVALADWRLGRQLPPAFRGWPPAAVILILVGLAVTYTTPWDNYLVATRVWWYDPSLVLGPTLGWVPLEEYLFFVLQSLLTGLSLLAVARRVPEAGRLPANGGRLRLWAALGAGAIWLVSVIILAAGWRPGTYLGLELVWALPPIALQLAFGADLLWSRRRVVAVTLLAATAYLCAADFLAIGSGTWTIDPAQSLHVLVAGVLPLEEIIFFLLTNTLLVFGATLALAPESQERLGRLKAAFLPLAVRQKAR